MKITEKDFIGIINMSVSFGFKVSIPGKVQLASDMLKLDNPGELPKDFHGKKYNFKMVSDGHCIYLGE